jgi:hypothetical protein
MLRPGLGLRFVVERQEVQFNRYCLGTCNSSQTMEHFMSADGELLARVSDTKDFFQSVLYRDTLPDWTLAREFGEFLVRILPNDIMGHVLLARAHRHLGSLDLARDELKQCQAYIKTRELEQWEAEDFLPLLAQEERLLTEKTPDREPNKE